MAASLEHETFSRHLHTSFRISPSESNAVEAELSTVGDLQLSPHQERFAIIFRLPKEPFLPQGSYTFDHDVMGEFTLFIVPVGQDDAGTYYEACFNRMRKPEK